jgi:hypothetical protein
MGIFSPLMVSFHCLLNFKCLWWEISCGWDVYHLITIVWLSLKTCKTYFKLVKIDFNFKLWYACLCLMCLFCLVFIYCTFKNYKPTFFTVFEDCQLCFQKCLFSIILPFSLVWNMHFLQLPIFPKLLWGCIHVHLYSSASMILLMYFQIHLFFFYCKSALKTFIFSNFKYCIFNFDIPFVLFLSVSFSPIRICFNFLWEH